jgi:hypothetical protein
MLYRRTIKLRLKQATSPVVGRAGKMAEKLILETSLKSPQYWLSVVSRDTMGVVDAGKIEVADGLPNTGSPEPVLGVRGFYIFSFRLPVSRGAWWRCCGRCSDR